MSGYIEHTTADNDRWDLLAWKYYGDATKYEPIIVANPTVPITPVLPSGIKLMIPVLDQDSVPAVDEAPWKSYGAE